MILVLLVLLVFNQPLQVTTSPNSTSSPDPQIFSLELGKPVHSQLSGEQKHSYQIALTKENYAKVLLEQQGVDLVAHVFGTDGRLIADVDSSRTNQGSEIVEVVAEATGSYRIEVERRDITPRRGDYTIQLAELRGASENETRLHEAQKEYYQSLRFIESGNTTKAVDAATRALNTREEILGGNHSDVAASLLALGTAYSANGDSQRADDALKRAAEITIKAFGDKSLEYADVLHAQAQSRFTQGEHSQAEELNLEALAIRERTAGPDSLAAASSLLNLGMLYRTINDLSKAEQSYLKVLKIRETILGPNHAEVAQLLNVLGLLYYGAGDFDTAEPILKRALAIREAAFGPNHRLVASVLNNLGLVEWKRRNFDKAEAYHRRAMSVYEKATGPESYGVGSSLHNLGILYKEVAQDYAKAEEYYQRALAIWQKLYGEIHGGTATALTSLGLLNEAKGDFDRALGFHLRANAIYEKLYGSTNHYTLLTLRALADVYAIQGDMDRALEYQQRINAIEARIFPLNLTIGSERQKIAYFTQLQTNDTTISFHVDKASNNAGARDLAATKILQRKGRVLDALSQDLAALRRRSNRENQALLDKLAEINSRLARVVLSGPQKLSVAEHQKQIKALEDEREELEAEVSRKNSGFYAGMQPISLASVKASVPDRTTLVEFAVYRPVNWGVRGEKPRYADPHYVAYIIDRDKEVRWVKLGPARVIDAEVDALREALRNPRRQDVQQLARALDSRLMQPVRALAGDTNHFLISPDGQLNLLPFAALVDESGKYLIERYSFSYLTSGRDLLRLQVARSSKVPAVIVANPSFGEVKEQSVASTRRERSSLVVNTASVTNASDIADVYFAPLIGTDLEANTIKSLFPAASILSGPSATETAIKAVTAPQLLHIATHGFFLGSSAGVQGNPLVATRGINANAKIGNPLLRSGLALTGANKHFVDGDDGILTALEASGLNLWGTKLVVLSACDTGVGEVRNGEGVYGLRRAFVLAGAESLVMSLWPASDYTTRKLMTDYYKNLKQGMGRGDSLRQVQLNMLKRDKHLHPFYWANFIQSGEWANLAGVR